MREDQYLGSGRIVIGRKLGGSTRAGSSELQLNHSSVPLLHHLTLPPSTLSPPHLLASHFSNPLALLAWILFLSTLAN
ncbi:hypothetical protein BDV37DRAFT_116027 [Aspergillus pseudonomiae]|uniref:Uncharacterized protein n=1 Tax=Aspergillus pseudonomiae TaxID=1506151 RepID=A0A5N7DD56_9EURO|nr:uncharacterized protein BDV37DRAFT_116027 [Aspergillus pseudonomiae]KAE8404169.1 hypothetical protein BDV37DRAFT_116027 [Aspergillus pseudonomiae]